MKVSDIVKEGENAIDVLKKRTIPEPDFQELKKYYDIYKSDVFDLTKRPNKPIKDNDGNLERYELVNRIALAMSKLIVERAVAFTFGNPVKIDVETENDLQVKLVQSVKKVLSDNKEYSLNRKIARQIFKMTEAAECWFTVDAKKGFNSYGFDSKRRLRCTIFSEKNGDKLYPLFDETGDMIAFSREYEIKSNGDLRKYFETYTDEEKVTWTYTGGSYGEMETEVNPIGRIPIVYGRQDYTEVHDVVPLINRLNKLLSNFADTNDYHASPKIFVNGTIKGFAQKGESGAILEGEENASAQYLSWDHAPESVRLEIDTLIEQIFALTQTPNISFDSVKAIGNISGIALKLLFLDAHLKVRNKEEIFIEYFQRRYNIIKAYLAEMNNGFKSEVNLTMLPVINPYMIDDVMSDVQVLSLANGGKPIISQKTSLRLSDFVNDTDEEYDQIQQEAEHERTRSIFEPTI